MKNWKKRAISILFAITLLTGTALAATYECVSVEYPIIVNGETMTFTDAEPMNYNGRTMLPLRAVADALGVPIEWDENNQQVIIETVQPSTSPEPTIDTEALKDACVKIHVGTDGKYTHQGSGVLIDYDEILTCYHVVDEGKTMFKAFYEDGTEKQCDLTDTADSYYNTTEGRTTDMDAAILRPEDTNVKPVKVGDSDTVDVGDKIYVISSPEGKKNVVTSGVVEAAGHDNGMYVYGATAKTEPGSSGGAVFNSNGELVGIISSASGEYCWIIPINHIREALAS